MRFRSAHLSSAFTLIELMVVIIIMGVIMTIAVPALRGMVGNAGSQNAINQISAALATTRATALSTGKDAALIFVCDSTSNSFMMRVTTFTASYTDASSNVFAGFTDLADRPPEHLTGSVRVQFPDLSNSGRFAPTPISFAVRFGPDGVVHTSDSSGNYRMWYDIDGDGTQNPADYYPPTSTPPSTTPLTFFPATFIALYDEQDFQSRDLTIYNLPTTDPQYRNQWITDNANTQAANSLVQVLMFNRYSGSLLRK